MNKLKYLLLLILLLGLSKPMSARAGCCKIIIWYQGASKNVLTENTNNQGDCQDFCNGKNNSYYYLGDQCQSVWRPNDSTNIKGNNLCLKDDSCCLTTLNGSPRAYYVTDDTECQYYCLDNVNNRTNIIGCNAQFYQGVKPLSGTACVKPSPLQPSGQAGNPTQLPAITLTNPLGTVDVREVIGSIIEWFLKIIGAIALLIFVYGGFLWLTSAGNDKAVKAGKDTLLWAAIGLILVFLSYILVGYFIQALGVA